VTYCTTVVLDRPFDDAVAAVRAALFDRGFRRAHRDRRAGHDEGKARRGPRALPDPGAYNLARLRARQAEASVGLLLPSNVIIRQTDQCAVVEAVDPMTMVSISGNSALQPVVDEVAGRLNAVLAALTALTT
jgi:hypothetical protein